MEISGPDRFRDRKTPPTDRFLGTYLSGQPQNTATNTITEEAELHEDDIFSTGDFSESSNHHHHHHQQRNVNNSSSSSSSNKDDDSPPSSTLCSPRRHHRHHHHHSNLSPNHKAFQPAESFGILAALPEQKSGSLHHVYQKTTVSSSSSSSSSSSTSSTSSSSRLIPSVPKPPQERLPTSASFSRYHQHHSAPVKVPVLSMAMRKARNREFDEIDEDTEEADGEMLPPHEIVARSRSPAVACSVLEGVGRTLRGRDLRQVRNAVLRRTGFLD